MDNSDNFATSTGSSDQFDNSDWFLQALVDICNGSESEMFFSITLNVGGLLISGELIGGEHYFNGIANDLEWSGIHPKIADAFRKPAEIYTKQREKVPGGEESNSPPKFIHLRNARIFHPSGNPIPTNRGTWWRGQLNAVDGFILGTLSAGQ